MSSSHFSSENETNTNPWKISHIPDESVLEPYRYLRDGPAGKEFRSVLIDCFQVWLDIPDETISVIKEIIASLHTASLLIDDIEDNSQLRRGAPVAHAIYGIPSTINCANYVYFLALEKCQALGNIKAISVFVLELLNLHRGQGQDILWRDTCTCPTEAQYLEMIKDKTGGLFRLAVGLMQAFSKNQTTNFDALLNSLAYYFQIRDDYMNLMSNEYMQTKMFCEDLTEGKFSYPVIHCLRSHSEDTRLSSILRQRTQDYNVKKHAVEWMKQCGSLEYTRNTIATLKMEVLNEIERLGGHSLLSGFIEKLDSTIPNP